MGRESGRVVSRPVSVHHCDPGWVYEVSDDGTYRYGIPPTPWEFPAGTVWLCGCDRTWVSMGSPAANLPGVCHWRREGRLARWWRERRSRRPADPPPAAGVQVMATRMDPGYEPPSASMGPDVCPRGGAR